MPADAARFLNSHFNDILKMPDIVSCMATLGAVPADGEAGKLTEEAASAYDRFGQLVKEFGIKAD